MDHVIQWQDKHSASLADVLEKKISGWRVTLEPDDWLPGQFIQAAAANRGLADYKDFPHRCYAIWSAVTLRCGADGARAFLALVICLAMKQTVASRRFAHLPARVRRGQAGHFEWLASQLSGSESWLDLGHDTFQKEFGLAALRLYVCGAQLVDYQCGVPRSLLLKNGVRNLFPGLAYFFRARGFKPYFQIHTHVHRLQYFTEQGWDECYQCCAELYAIHPDVLGMCGGSWFYDPAITELSPRLRYLQDVPLAGGARLFRCGTSAACVNDAVSTSPTRKALYDKGLYTPCSYVLVWDRVAQSQWAAGG